MYEGQASDVQMYMEVLMKRHASGLALAQKAVQQQTDKIQQRIQNGKYDIRESQQSIQPKKIVREEVNLKDVNSQKTQMIELKRNLESKLAGLESTLEQLTEKTNGSKGQLSEQQHEIFMKEIARTNKELQMRRQERKQMEDKKLQEKEQVTKKKEQLNRMERQKRKKQEIEQKIRRLQESKEKRQQQVEKQDKLLLGIMNAKPLYEKIQERHSQLQAMSLEEKKKKLAEIRSLHRPVTKQEIEQHKKKLDQFYQKKQQQKEEKINQFSDASLPGVYKSAWYKKLIADAKAEEVLKKQQEESEHEGAKQMREKLKQYGDYVKSNFKPEVDPTKSEELKVTVDKKEVRPEEMRKMGLQNLKWSKEHINPNKSLTEMGSTTSNQEKLKPVNYLEELRKNRAYTTHAMTSARQLDELMSRPMEEEARTKLLLEHVQKLEKIVQHKEEMAKASGRPVDQELSDLYMATAKAKLALLS